MTNSTAPTGTTSSAGRAVEHVEWPTISLITGFHLALVGLVLAHGSVPWPLALTAFALLGCLHLSLLHEVLHGHPTPSQRFNEALVAVPAVVWLPYAQYRDSHRRHHQAALTVPGDDPESFYVDAATWERANPIWRAVLTVNRTLLGRMAVWPAVAIGRTLRHATYAVRTDARARREWAVHLPAAVLTVWLVCGAGDVPWWMFIGGFTYGGMSLTYVRSFVEHLGVDRGTECAVVQSNAFFGLLFLNNNLHHTHHAAPDAAWYRLPRLRIELGSDRIAAEGAGLYRGYLDVARRYGLRPFDAPVHPSERDVHTGLAPASAS